VEVKMKNLLLILPLLFWIGCEEEEEAPIIYPLPTEFPLDKEYAWEYERKYYGSKTEWQLNFTPDTSYLDTLHVLPTENDYSFYWWGGSNPSYMRLVMNDGNNFICFGYVDLDDDTTVFYDEPSLWACYSEIFDTSALSDSYYNSFDTRITSVDTVNDTIYHSYVFSGEDINQWFEYFDRRKVDMFGIVGAEYYYDWEDSEDLYVKIEKVREINLSSGSIVSFDIEENRPFKTIPNSFQRNYPYNNPFEKSFLSNRLE
jgi:hypothetical protein